MIALVGLPARGKSFVARKLEAHLQWSGAQCKIFNVGKYRRKAYGETIQKEQRFITERDQKGACNADFFDPSNKQAADLRQQVAEMALRDMLRWLDCEDETDYDDDASCQGEYHRQNTGCSYGTTRAYVEHGRIAIFDATNSTDKRRQWILEECTSPEKRVGKQTGVVFVESVCDDQELLDENFRYKVANSPDFEGMSAEEALADLKNRVAKYESSYETIQDDSLSYIKVFNLSTKLLVNHIYGRMAKDLVPALMAWHIGTRPVYLCRPGQTMSGIVTDGEDYVATNSIDPSDPRFLDMSTKTRRRSMRGDSLGPNGTKFRERLFDFCYQEVREFVAKRASVRDNVFTGTSISGLAISSAPSADGTYSRNDPFPLKLITSTMPRAVDTVRWDDNEFSITQMSNLNPLDKGDFVGKEIDEWKSFDPAWFAKLERDPFGTRCVSDFVLIFFTHPLAHIILSTLRFPGGESYHDLIRRLTPVIIDVEQQVVPTLVVSHVSILQCLMAYFRNSPVDKCMSIEVPLHAVIKYTPVRGGGWSETIISLHDDTETMPLVPVLSTGELSAMSGSEHGPIWSDHLTANPCASPSPKPTKPIRFVT